MTLLTFLAVNWLSTGATGVMGATHLSEDEVRLIYTVVVGFSVSRNCKTSSDLGSTLALYHFHCLLLVKARHKPTETGGEANEIPP